MKILGKSKGVPGPSNTAAVERLSPVSTAARVRPDDQLWTQYRFTTETWQRECWRFYHNTPELHFAADYVGSACSRVRIIVVDVDDNGRPGEETDNAEIQAIGDTLFGSPGDKAEALNAIGVNLTVAGECYIIGRASRDVDPDKWSVVSSTQFKRRNGELRVDLGYGAEVVVPKRDLVIRLWTPDPERMRFATSPTRSALQPLAELEQLQLFEQSQIDSRLSGAGIYFIPAGLGLPSDDPDATAADDLFVRLAEAARAARTQQGSAASVVPVFVEVPEDKLQYMAEKPVKFESELSDRLQELRDTAIRRIANGLSIPNEILTGMSEANHWTAWWIEESFVKIQIEPLVNRVCAGLTTAYLRPLLRAMGRDPSRYMLWYDTAPLTVRPNRLQDTLNLYEKGIVSAKEVLIAGNYNPLTAAPSDEEESARYIRELMLRDPSLFQIPEVREAAGIENVETAAPETPIAGELEQPGPPPPPRPERSIEQPNTGPPTGTSSPGGTPILAASYVAGPSPLLSAANVVARRALRRAGAKIMSRSDLSRWPDLPHELRHTKIKVRPADVDRILDGAFDDLAADFEGQDIELGQLAATLREYCSVLLVSACAHQMPLLAAKLRTDGLDNSRE